MSPFPIVEVRRIRFGRRIKQEEKVDIHCHCQMPYDSNEQDSDMIQCNMCLMWYHERCISVSIKDFKHCKWFCSICHDIKMNLKNCLFVLLPWLLIEYCYY